MNPRNNHSYIILLAIVVVVGLLIAMLARLAILAKGADVGTANLVFLIVLGICAIFYLVVLTISSGVIDIVFRKHAFGRRRKQSADVRVVPNAPNIIEINRIKQEADRKYFDSQKEKLNLFIHYTQNALGPYITVVELSELVHYVECYAWQQPLPDDLHPVKPERLKNADLFHFGWNMANYYGQPKQEVVPWLKSVFVQLAELEDSYIKGKLYDGQTTRYIIPNIEDLEAYMSEQKG